MPIDTMRVVMEEVVITENSPDWLIGMPAVLNDRGDCIQPAAIAPNNWYTTTFIEWRARTDADPMYTCRRCWKQVHMLCKDKRCRDCAKLFA